MYMYSNDEVHEHMLWDLFCECSTFAYVIAIITGRIQFCAVN